MADLPNSATDLWLSDSDVTAGHWRPSLVAPPAPNALIHPTHSASLSLQQTIRLTKHTSVLTRLALILIDTDARMSLNVIIQLFC